LGDTSSTGLNLSISMNNIAIIPDGQRGRFRIGSLSVIDRKNQVLLMDPNKYQIILDDNHPINNNFELSIGNINNLDWCPHCKYNNRYTNTDPAEFIEISHYKLYFIIELLETGEDIKGFEYTFFVNYDPT
jgi:hypothetical protein